MGGVFVDVTEIATQAAEAAAGIGSILSGFKLVELSRDYYKLYSAQREWYYNVFQRGVEAPMASEVYTDARPTLNYAARVATAYNEDTGPFGGASTDTQGWWIRHASTYGAPADSRLSRELEVDEARVKSDWTNYLFRFEEQYYDVRNDIRWRKRIALHNAGIKQGTATSSALDSALGQYQGHVADFGEQLATYGNGIAKYVGYKRGLADTEAAFDAATYQPVRSRDLWLDRDSSRERLA